MILALLAVSAVAAPDSQVVVTVSLAGEAEAPDGKILLEPLDGTDAIETGLRLRQPLRIAVQDALYRLRIEAAGFWSRERIIATGETADVTLHPTGEITGRLRVPRGKPVPEMLSVRFRQPALAGAGLEGESECEVEAENFSCELPALALDLELRATGFVPVYSWEVPISAGALRALGDVELLSGASVAGWVIDEGADREARDGVEVELAPRTGETPAIPLPPATADRLRLANRRQTPRDRGFFQFRGVPPGVYRVVAHGPLGAISEAVEIEVTEERETRIARPLILRPPARFEVVIDPPAAPSGAPWELTLYALDRRAPSRRETADWSGNWTAKAVAPGRYRLEVGVDGATPAREQRWWTDVVEIEAPSTFLPISISWVDVHGEVRDGEGPARGVLFFGGRHGVPRITFETDTEGSFTGALPREGAWKVDFAARAEDVRVMRLDEVEVTVGPSGKAILAIELTGIRLEGRVVTSEGEPAPGAIVRVLSTERRSKEAEVVVDAEGRFELDSLRAGEVWVEAEGDAGRTAAVRLDLGDSPAEPLELVLRDDRILAGRVRSGGQNLSGALIRAMPILAEGVPFQVERVLTEPGGAFRLSLPADADAVHLVAASPGYATVWRRVDLPALDGGLVIDLPAAGTPLRVTLDGTPGVIVISEAGEIGMHFLADRTSREDGTVTFEVDRLAPGTYRLCPVELPATVRYDLCRQALTELGTAQSLLFEALPDSRK